MLDKEKEVISSAVDIYIYRWPRIIPFGDQSYDYIQVPVNISKKNICGKRTVNI
jgi:hypothetical protein